jgi:16S rRNA (uracil1498-N3)-methyltransferase
MARRRFFVPPLRNGATEVSGEDAHHLTRVLRVEAGQQYEIVAGGAIYLAEVEEARKNRVCFRALEPVPRKPLPVFVTVCFALFKFDRLEWLLEKCTEAGAAAFIPVIAVRSEKGLERAAGKRRARWERLLVESAQQSRRDDVPALHDPMPLGRLGSHLEIARRLLLDESGSAPPVLSVLRDATAPAGDVALLVGPEGGWTDGEREMAGRDGWRAVSLGPQILRSETAAVAACSIVMAAFAGARVPERSR